MREPYAEEQIPVHLGSGGPGVPAVPVNVSCRTQGFHVQKGNPKNIKGWSDLYSRHCRKEIARFSGNDYRDLGKIITEV